MDQPAPGVVNWLKFRLGKTTQTQIWKDTFLWIASQLQATIIQNSEFTAKLLDGDWDQDKRAIMRHVCGHEPTPTGFCQ